MFDTIEKLRQKPDSTKKKIAFLISFSVVGIIFVIWLSVIYPDFRKKEIKESNIAKLEPSPISAFTGTLSSGVSVIGEQFNKIKDIMFSFSYGPDYYVATTTEADKLQSRATEATSTE